MKNDANVSKTPAATRKVSGVNQRSEKAKVIDGDAVKAAVADAAKASACVLNLIARRLEMAREVLAEAVTEDDADPAKALIDRTAQECRATAEQLVEDNMFYGILHD